MAKQVRNLESIVGPMREPIAGFASLIQETAADRLSSLTLFGAIVAGTFDIRSHSVRSVLVLDSIDLSMLRRLSTHGATLGKNGIAAPLIMTPAYINDSLDTFPLELIEIHQKHLTLLGDDPFNELSFADADVRLQSERELKSLLIRMRQGLLSAAGREKFIEALEVNIGEEILRTLRGLMWLQGQKGATPASEVLSAVESKIEKKLTGIRAAVDGSATHGWDQFVKLYNDVTTLSEAVDAW